MSVRNVGIIGAGAMGGAIVERLIGCGTVPAVYDLDTAAVARLGKLGARDGRLESIGKCDILLSCLPTDQAVHDALVQSDMMSLVSGGVLIEMSTVLPDTLTALAAAAREADVGVVDSAISGGPADARAGNLVLLVGGEEETIARVKDTMSILGNIVRVGYVGDGKRVKLINNLMTLGNMVVGAEAFTLGLALGFERTKLFEILTLLGGSSTVMRKRMPFALDNDFEARFATKLAEKDLRLALEMAHRRHHAMPIAASIHQIYEMGVARGLAEEDMVSVVRLYKESWEIEC